MIKGDRRYSGNVGEHYVLYRLIQEGFNAVLAAPNTDAVDIYVADIERQTVRGPGED